MFPSLQTPVPVSVLSQERSRQLPLPWGAAHKDPQHDSFLNLPPTVPNQPLVMRRVRQENNRAHSLSDWQTRQSLRTHWYVNQTLSFEKLLGLLTTLQLYKTIRKYHRSVGAMTWSIASLHPFFMNCCFFVLDCWPCRSLKHAPSILTCMNVCRVRPFNITSPSLKVNVVLS